jgi:hypothetical protein
MADSESAATGSGSAAAHARQPNDVGVFVPEGPNEGSQAIYCLEQVQSRVRPVLSAIARMADKTRRIMSTHYQLSGLATLVSSLRDKGQFPYVDANGWVPAVKIGKISFDDK